MGAALWLGCATSPPPPTLPIAPAFDPGGGRWVASDEVEERLARARFAVLGEHHDHPEHHLFQAALLRSLVERGRRPAVAFEMLDADDQPLLDALAARGERDLDRWRDELAWEQRGWPAWELYRPIFEVAVGAGLTIVPAHFDKATRGRLAKEGRDAIEDPAIARVAALPLATEDRQALEREIREGHCNMLPDEHVPRMMQVQRIWDAGMAVALWRSATADGAVLIAGRGHGRQERGVPWALRQLDADADVFSLAFVEFPIDPDDPTWQDTHARDVTSYDLVVPTDPVEREDPCEAFARAHPRKGAQSE